MPPHDGITLLRALVCLSIVTLHFFPAAFARWPDDPRFLPSPMQLMAHWRLGFESFFVLAGYFLAHGFRPGPWHTFSVLKFFRRRLLRLVVPYWVALLVVGAGGYALSAALRRENDMVAWADLWPQALFIQDLVPARSVGYALWFMSCLMQFYVLWCAAFWLVRRRLLRAELPRYHAATLRIMRRWMGAAFVVSRFGRRGQTPSALGAPCQRALPGVGRLRLLAQPADGFPEFVVRCVGGGDSARALDGNIAAPRSGGDKRPAAGRCWQGLPRGPFAGLAGDGRPVLLQHLPDAHFHRASRDQSGRCDPQPRLLGVVGDADRLGQRNRGQRLVWRGILSGRGATVQTLYFRDGISVGE